MGLPEFSVSVDAGLPEFGASVDAGLPQEAELVVEIPTAEVTEIQLEGLPEFSASADVGLPEVDASTAIECELNEYGAPPCQEVEVTVDVQASFEPREMTVNDVEESVLISPEVAETSLRVEDLVVHFQKPEDTVECGLEYSASVAQEVLEIASELPAPALPEVVVKGVEGSVLFPANACPAPSPVRAVPVLMCVEVLPQTAPGMAVEALEVGASVDVGLPEFSASVDAGLPELSVSVDAGLPELSVSVDAGLPEFSASVDAGLPQDAQEVEVAVEIPLVSGELCAYGAPPDAELQPNLQEVEVAVNIQASVDPREVTEASFRVEEPVGVDVLPDVALNAVPVEAEALLELKCGVECSVPAAEEVLEFASEPPACALQGVVLNGVGESVLFPANAWPTTPSIIATPVPKAGVSFGFEGVKLESNAEDVEFAVEIPLASGDMQPFRDMALTAEVAEAHLEVDASPALKTELCEYGAPADAGLDVNVQVAPAAIAVDAFVEVDASARVELAAGAPLEAGLEPNMEKVEV